MVIMTKSRWNVLHKGEVLRSLAKISKQNQHILHLLDSKTSDPAHISLASHSFVFCLGGRQVIVFHLSFLYLKLVVQSYVVVCASTNTGKVMICEPVQINSFVQSRRARWTSKSKQSRSNDEFIKLGKNIFRRMFFMVDHVQTVKWSYA